MAVLAGRVAVVTGASMSIGAGLAAMLAAEGAQVALTEVIQDANHDNGIQAWVICSGFVDTDIGYVIPAPTRPAF